MLLSLCVSSFEFLDTTTIITNLDLIQFWEPNLMED